MDDVIDMDHGRKAISDFLTKAYEMVDDPSTDSLISWSPNGQSFVVWKPLECCRDLLTRRLQITNFARFESYGFRKIVISSGQNLEFDCNDFVRGKPELLDNIVERYVAKMKAFYDRKYGELDRRMKSATSREEIDLANKEFKERCERESKERKARRPPTRVTPNLQFIDLTWGRDEIFDFLKKAYQLVDDPSTDSIISWAPTGHSFVVWNPMECCRDLLPQYLQVPHFAKFHAYGFIKRDIPYQQQLVYSCTDFVRGKPELLEKVAERYMAQLKDNEVWRINERVKNATSREEYDLAIKERNEMYARKSKERKERMARSATRVVASSPAQGL